MFISGYANTGKKFSIAFIKYLSRVAGPKSRSRVQCRGRGSNVAAGENDLEFEVTE